MPRSAPERPGRPGPGYQGSGGGGGAHAPRPTPESGIGRGVIVRDYLPAGVQLFHWPLRSNSTSSGMLLRSRSRMVASRPSPVMMSR